MRYRCNKVICGVQNDAAQIEAKKPTEESDIAMISQQYVLQYEGLIDVLSSATLEYLERKH